MQTRHLFARTIGLCAGCLLAALLSIGACEARTPRGKDDEALKTLRKFSDEMNKSCPVAFDATTSLKGTIILPPRTLRFEVTIPDSTQVETLQKNLVPLLRSMVREAPGMKSLHDAGTIFSFWFETAESEHLFDVEVTPDDYRNNARK